MQDTRKKITSVCEVTPHFVAVLYTNFELSGNRGSKCHQAVMESSR